MKERNCMVAMILCAILCLVNATVVQAVDTGYVGLAEFQKENNDPGSSVISPRYSCVVKYKSEQNNYNIVYKLPEELVNQFMFCPKNFNELLTALFKFHAKRLIDNNACSKVLQEGLPSDKELLKEQCEFPLKDIYKNEEHADVMKFPPEAIFYTMYCPWRIKYFTKEELIQSHQLYDELGKMNDEQINWKQPSELFAPQGCKKVPFEVLLGELVKNNRHLANVLEMYDQTYYAQDFNIEEYKKNRKFLESLVAIKEFNKEKMLDMYKKYFEKNMDVKLFMTPLNTYYLKHEVRQEISREFEQHKKNGTLKKIAFQRRDGLKNPIIIVLTKDGLYYDKNVTIGHINHSSIARGQKVLFAGELSKSDDGVNLNRKLISNSSGHYRPLATSFVSLFKYFLENKIDMTDMEFSYEPASIMNQNGKDGVDAFIKKHFPQITRDTEWTNLKQ